MEQTQEKLKELKEHLKKDEDHINYDEDRYEGKWQDQSLPLWTRQVELEATMKLCGRTLYSIFRRKLYAKGFYTKAVIFKHEIWCPMSSTRPHVPSASFS